MLKGCGSNIPLVPVLIKKDVYNFGLLAVRLCETKLLSKDIAKYITRWFFYQWVLLSDSVYYNERVPIEKPNCAYERLKTENRVSMKNPGDMYIAEIAYAYGKSGKKVVYMNSINMIDGIRVLGFRISDYSGSMFFNNGGCIIPNYKSFGVKSDLYIMSCDEYSTKVLITLSDKVVILLINFK
jgi:hypothetical protein